MKVRGGGTDDSLLSEWMDTALGSQKKLVQVCEAAGGESLLLIEVHSLPLDLL